MATLYWVQGRRSPAEIARACAAAGVMLVVEPDQAPELNYTWRRQETRRRVALRRGQIAWQRWSGLGRDDPEGAAERAFAAQVAKHLPMCVLGLDDPDDLARLAQAIALPQRLDVAPLPLHAQAALAGAEHAGEAD